MKLCPKCKTLLPPDRRNCTLVGDQSPEYYYVHQVCPKPVPIVAPAPEPILDEPLAKGKKSKKAARG